MTLDSPQDAAEVVAKLRDWESRNGNVLDFVLRREWMHHVTLLVGVIEFQQAALKPALPYVTGTGDARRVTDAIHQASRVLGS